MNEPIKKMNTERKINVCLCLELLPIHLRIVYFQEVLYFSSRIFIVLAIVALDYDAILLKYYVGITQSAVTQFIKVSTVHVPYIVSYQDKL